jgi:hypothetical protein
MITTDPLSIYLQDHHAGACFGLELARRAAGENRGTELGDFLTRLAKEIEDDREELEAIMSELGVGADRLKVVGAWTSEKLGRLKLNGRLLGYAPLSRVLELEGLLAGVEGKLALWRALRERPPGGVRVDEAQIERLERRAQRQLRELRTRHKRAARLAFVES